MNLIFIAVKVASHLSVIQLLRHFFTTYSNVRLSMNTKPAQQERGINFDLIHSDLISKFLI